MTKTVDLVCVDPERIEEIWPHVETLIARSVMTGLGDDTLEDIQSDLLCGDALLWIVWEKPPGRLLAAATTKLFTTSRGKICVITSCAGRDLDKWKQFIRQIEQYAIDEGCGLFRMYGRPGWKRVFEDYSEPYVTIEKAL